MEGIILKKPVIFLLILGLFITGFFILAPLAKAESAPPAINYAPNFWFDSQEQYYPANPLDFYFENGIEINGEIAVNKYNQLSLETKLENMTILYHILDYGSQWIYQYWCFYVLNDYYKGIKNKHYGDWEAVFVFVDKESKEVVKVIGTAHQRKFFDIEIYFPQNNHIWTYVGGGSHANCIDEEPDGYCNFLKWRKFEAWDKMGSKIHYNNYNLQEITLDFINKFGGAITFEESSKLGINLFELIKIKGKEFYISFGGSPPTHAWAQSNYYNPEELRPIGIKYALEKVNQATNQIAGFFDNLVSGVASFFKGLGGSQEAGISQTVGYQEDLTEPLPEITFKTGIDELPSSKIAEPKSEIKVVKGEPTGQKVEEIDSLPEITFSTGEPGSGLGGIEKQPAEKEESEKKESAAGTSFISGGSGGSGGASALPDEEGTEDEGEESGEESDEDSESGESESEENEEEDEEEDDSGQATTTPPLLPPKIISPCSGDIFGQAAMITPRPRPPSRLI